MLAHANARALDGLLDDAAVYLAAAERLAPTVPGDRRWLFDLRLAGISLFVARQGGDVATAREQARAVEGALATAPASPTGRERALGRDDRAVALLNLGIAELWSLRPDEARAHLEEALELAVHAGRPYVEIACVSHLGLAEAVGRRSATGALELAERAVAMAETHGWTTDPIAAAAFALGGNLLVRQGRLDDGERWLERADRALAGAEPGTALILHSARGLLALGAADRRRRSRPSAARSGRRPRCPVSTR